jgi:quercetin dioxygenase-like cupin family protein
MFKLLSANLSMLVITVGGFAMDSVAQETKSAPTRAILERHDETGVPGREIVLGTAELPAGAEVPWHTHYGDEAGYVIKGDLILRVRGQPDRQLRAGDHFFNPRGVAHTLLAAPGTAGGIALSTWVVDKGKPLVQPVNRRHQNF